MNKLKFQILFLLAFPNLMLASNTLLSSAAAIELDSTIPNPILLKELALNTTYFNLKTKSMPKLDKKAVAEQGLDKVFGELYATQPGVRVKVVDTLLITDKTKIIVVAKKSDNEHVIWIVQYDARNQVKTNFVAYSDDFIESFTTTKTVVKNNQITVSIYDNMETKNKPTRTKWFLNDQQQLTNKK